MPRGNPKITKEMEAAILTLTAKRKSNRWIAEHLLKKFRVKVSHVAVGNVVRAARRELGTAAGAIVRQELGENLPRDLRVFDRRLKALAVNIRALEAASEAMRERFPRDPTKWASTLDLLNRTNEVYRKCLHTKLHYVGADERETKIDSFSDFVMLGLEGQGDAGS